jgi:P-type Cu2+ transporter
MSETFHFSLPGITCINCIIPVEDALRKCTSIKIESFSSDVFGKTITITVADAQNTHQEISSILKTIIEGVGVDCSEIIDTENLYILPTEQDISLESSLRTVQGKKARVKKKVVRQHLIKGILATVFGIGLIALTLSGFGLPLIAIYILLGASSLLTLILGAESYYEAIKKLIKAKTLTMDALFTVSTLVVIGASIASIFFPWFPMMLEGGLLIFGFRHIGKAIEESIKEKISSRVAFKDRSVSKVQKLVQQDEIYAWEEYPITELQIGDIIRVKHGDVVPVDGTCENDNTSIYTTIKTGSTIPMTITRGEEILAGMIVPDDVEYINIKIEKLPNQSYLARLDDKVIQANTEKAPIETVTNKILQYFVPAVLVLAAISGIAIGVVFNPALAIQCAISVLIAACPCILGFITPLAIKIGISKSLENRVQFKSGKALQIASNIDTVVFDLNGTLTRGVPIVTSHQIIPDRNTSPQEFFTCLALIEKESQHPIAKAIHTYAASEVSTRTNMKVYGIDLKDNSGIKGKIEDNEYLIGNKIFLNHNQIDYSDIDITINGGEQIIYCVKNKKIIGYVKITDPLREDAIFTITELKRMGIDSHISTGTDIDTAKYFAKVLRIPEANIFANAVGASDNENEHTKTSYNERLKAQNKRVAMVGDAANDALAIANSDFGIAVKSNYVDVMTQQEAGAVISTSELLPVVTIFAVAKETVRSIKVNLLSSLTYNMIILLIAGGVLVGIGFALNPAIGVALMVLQTALVLLYQYRIKCRELPHLKRYQEEQAKKTPDLPTYKKFMQNGLRMQKNPELTVSLESKASSDGITASAISNNIDQHELCPLPVGPITKFDSLDGTFETRLMY